MILFFWKCVLYVKSLVWAGSVLFLVPNFKFMQTTKFRDHKLDQLANNYVFQVRVISDFNEFIELLFLK